MELHGSLKYVNCLKCGKTYEWEDIVDKIDDIKCENCGSVYLKPRIVFFGEQLPRDVLNEAIREAENSDVFIVVGSSLQVYPAASLPFIARKSCAKLILINKDPTDKDWMFDIIVYGRAGEILTKIVEKVKEMI